MADEASRAAILDDVVTLAGSRFGGDERDRLLRFIRVYYSRVPLEDMAGRPALDLYGAALAHWRLALTRHPGTPVIKAYTPRFAEDGWQSPHSVIEIVDDDLTFLVDSVRMALTRRGLGMHLVIHPIMRVRRDARGELVDVAETDGVGGEPVGGEGERGDGWRDEAVVHVEFDRQGDPDAVTALEADLRRVEGDVRATSEDWGAMLDALEGVAGEVEGGAAGVPSGDAGEAVAFLRWLAGGFFTFLGYRQYDLREGRLVAVPGTGLGTRRDRADGAPLPEEDVAVAGDGSAPLLVLTKASSLSTVHRPAHLDQVSVTRYDGSGRPIGEHRFLGLYNPVVYDTHPGEIPVVRRKVGAVLERASLPLASHAGRELRTVLETYPRDELFEVTEDELYATAMGICGLQERQRVRLFTRRDRYGRFFSCLVYLPRNRLDTTTHQRIEAILRDALRGRSIESWAALSESVLARLHVLVYVDPGEEGPKDLAALEQRLADSVRTWTDDLRDALVDELGEDDGLRLLRQYGGAFPAGYRADFVARVGVADLLRLEALDPRGDLDLSLYHPVEAPPGTARLKLYRSGSPLLVSTLLPLLEHMGALVIDERPYEIRPAAGPCRWIYDFGLRTGLAGQLANDEARRRFHHAFLAVWQGRAEDDGYNRLIVGGGLDWQQVVVLRAYARYLQQTGTAPSPAYVEETVAGHPEVARVLVELFRIRFDPDLQLGGRATVPAPAGTSAPAVTAAAAGRGPEAGPSPSADDSEIGEPGEAGRAAASSALSEEASKAIDMVANLDDDRILRSLLALVGATVRTNAFQMGPDGERPPYLTIKLDSSRVRELPRPRPMFEVFVYSPRMEGVHLRGGRVARGGIRWSDRREDYRTETLGLMKAQMVKNAVIVPVGSKGGFVVRRPPGDRGDLAQEVVTAYRTLIAGLLSVTDNLAGDGVVPPSRTVRYDGDDPYLVVAADKGTATFSDIANEIALGRGYWLGDAFASGGRTGYDHKKMGITARGAWESSRQHFADLGLDADRDLLTVVGIGDMSGDVFGNGMLLSRHLALVAAFDHRHIFLDPNPDLERSYRERERLFHLPRSSWDDYDLSVLSPGGGVFPRTAKSVALPMEAQATLGLDADVVTPDELIRAILRAPVDLIWNGGIGTYVKASDETHADVADKGNDRVRIDAPELRCRVVVEGGNLGLTQRARVEAALAGTRLNTDAIDNSGGVDCSDHEVNIKILLDGFVASGDLTRRQRDDLLAQMADEVTHLVVAHNRRQNQALADAAAESSLLLGVHRRYIRFLEHAGRLDPKLEGLPSDDDFAGRKAAGLGLTAPELAVLLAYTKNGLYGDLLDSGLAEHPGVTGELTAYFPVQLRDRFGDRLDRHPLRREIVANEVSNELVDRQGISFVYRLAEETGATPAEITAAYLVARDVLGARALWAAVEDASEAEGARFPGPARTAVFLEIRKQVGRATRWLLRHRRPPLDLAREVRRFAPGAAELAERLPSLLGGLGRPLGVEPAPGHRRETAPDRSGEPALVQALRRRVALLEPLGAVFDLVEVAEEVGQPVAGVAAVHLTVGDHLDLYWLGRQIQGLPRSSRWQNLARDTLRDELAHRHRAMTTAVCRETPPDGRARDRVEGWLAGNRPAVERIRQVVEEIKSGPVDLATLTVALREYERLVPTG